MHIGKRAGANKVRGKRGTSNGDPIEGLMTELAVPGSRTRKGVFTCGLAFAFVYMCINE